MTSQDLSTKNIKSGFGYLNFEIFGPMLSYMLQFFAHNLNIPIHLNQIRYANMIFEPKLINSGQYLCLKSGCADEFFNLLQGNDSRWCYVGTEAKFLV